VGESQFHCRRDREGPIFIANDGASGALQGVSQRLLCESKVGSEEF
jgi:hypothetical protein